MSEEFGPGMKIPRIACVSLAMTVCLNHRTETISSSRGELELTVLSLLFPGAGIKCSNGSYSLRPGENGNHHTGAYHNGTQYHPMIDRKNRRHSRLFPKKRAPEPYYIRGCAILKTPKRKYSLGIR